MTEVTITGPVAEPVSGGPAKQLILLLHGVGADGSDLIGLVPYVADSLPDAAFVAPDAPFAYDMAPFGRQWFSLQDRSEQALAAGIRETAPLLDAFIDAELARRGLTDSDLALVGFSQGTMMSLHVGPRRERACAAIIGFSGALLQPDSLAQELKSRPRVLLVHGDADPVVNPACLAHAEENLSRFGIPVLAEMRPGLDHSIDGPGLGLALAFLRHSFGLEENAPE